MTMKEYIKVEQREKVTVTGRKQESASILERCPDTGSKGGGGIMIGDVLVCGMHE